MTHQMFCFPYAGGGASFYRAWPAGDDLGFELRPVQLPGREELFVQDPYPSIGHAAGDLADQIARSVTGDDEISLFGHSFGAILAFEVARRLVASVSPRHLVVSGSANPLTMLPREETAELDDDQFIARVQRRAGYTHPALADPDLRDIVLPALRADVALHDSYVAEDPRPIPVPITVVRGESDHIVSRSDCAGWASATSDRYEQAELPGGHMYLVDDPAPLLGLLRRISTGSVL